MPHASSEDKLIEQPALGSLAELDDFLAKVRVHVPPAKEPTLFAVGGRGYYENPASDLLAFFLNPDAKHGLGDLFLSTFLDSMKVDKGQLKMSYVGVEREVYTVDQKRIDRQILGSEWCLLIENKIRHWQANPFISYEDHAKRLGRKTNFFAILSPDGCSKKAGWKGVSYRDYCTALRVKMAAIFSDPTQSKWHLFAREFIQHLENELYNPPMTPEQVTFVENHSDEISGVQKLVVQYQSFILQQLKQQLEDAVPGIVFETRIDAWPYHVFVFRCSSPHWGQNDMVLYKTEGPDNKFYIRFYLDNPSEPRRSNANQDLQHMRPAVDGQFPYWSSVSGCFSAQEAISELCKLAKTVNNLLKT